MENKTVVLIIIAAVAAAMLLLGFFFVLGIAAIQKSVEHIMRD